ncbi:unnamed protein product [Caenorhabditis auriculariae]|uniref:Uncharacterized protein n=1 Tax=Caenorhabditis auriculariae TaxID=2777116 RepID=A0A8S1HG89_9PELO|nr:unnamed protein product [Caenorhabditis auriculariae]
MNWSPMKNLPASTGRPRVQQDVLRYELLAWPRIAQQAGMLTPGKTSRSFRELSLYANDTSLSSQSKCSSGQSHWKINDSSVRRQIGELMAARHAGLTSS